MKPLLQRLNKGMPLVGDGALGTVLMASGAQPGECLEALNLTRPELLEDIARCYLEAGSELVTTNTFGASPFKLAMYGLADQADEINRAAVAAVRKVVGEGAYVAGSVGPCGKLLKPYGHADPDAVLESYRRQVRVLIDAGVDVIYVETMTDLIEAKLAVQAAKEVAPIVPVSAAMTFDPTPRGFFTIMGVSVAKAAAGLAEAGADVIGSNCGHGVEHMVGVAREFRRCTSLPLIIQPNAGRPEMTANGPVYPETPEFLAEKARELAAIGVSIIGGCCGTTPEHIRAIRKMVDES